MKTLTLFTAVALVCSASLLQAKEGQRAHVNVIIEVPNPTWSTQIQKAYTKEGKLLVVCHMTQAPGAGIMMISKAKDSIQLPIALTKLPKKILLTGKTWNWSNGGYTAVTTEELKKTLKGATLVYPEKKKTPK